MTLQPTARAHRAVRLVRTCAAGILAAATILAFAADRAHAQPPAGTSIGNQATASYLDASSTSRTVTSNLVTTIVQQVASFSLTADGSVLAAPGAQAVFPHILTNTGNGADSFPLTLVNLAGDHFDLAGPAIYPHADGNAVPDKSPAIPTTGGTLFGWSPGRPIAGASRLTRVRPASSGPSVLMTATATSRSSFASCAR